MEEEAEILRSSKSQFNNNLFSPSIPGKELEGKLK
jgi:hypothetical protein